MTAPDMLSAAQRIAAQRDALWAALVAIAAATEQPDTDALAVVERLAREGMDRARNCG